MSSIKLKGSSSGEAILTTDATASKFSFDKNLTASAVEFITTSNSL